MNRRDFLLAFAGIPAAAAVVAKGPATTGLQFTQGMLDDSVSTFSGWYSVDDGENWVWFSGPIVDVRIPEVKEACLSMSET